MKKKIGITILVLIFALLLASCGKPADTAEPDPVVPSDPSDPKEPTEPAVPSVSEEEDSRVRVGYTDEEESYSYSFLFGDALFSDYGTGAELAAALGRGEIDTAVIPTNLACSVYRSSGGKIAIIGVCLSGDVWIMESNDDEMIYADIIDPDILYERTVYIPYEGGAEDAIVRAVCNTHKLTEGKTVFFEYLPYGEIEEQVKSEAGSFACVPTPMNDNYPIGFSASWAWQNDTGRSVCPIYCVAVNTDNLKDEGLAAVIAAVSDSGGYLTGEYEIMDAVTPYLRALYNVKPSLIGGFMPDDGIYGG
ncbi:MAG: hypothetical protein II443_06900 [Oscillospiraceae bacterium]|nr:hypothetical protein [Oscillospiraceae bacterium]